MSLREIRCFLTSFLESGEKIGPMKIEYDRGGQDTGRTLIMCSDSLYKRLIDLGFGNYHQKNNFRIVPYRVPDNFQLKDGLHSDLYLSIPKTMTREEFMLKIQEFFQSCVDFGLLRENSWRIQVFYKNIPNEDIQGNAILSFQDSISFLVVYIIKAFLDRMTWVKTQLHFRCYWLRNTLP